MFARNQLSSLDATPTPIDNGGYLMINRMEVRNFRCFDTLQLNGLRRFNLLVGESGSGKTALLETIFLLSSGSPEAYFRLRRWRGFGEGALELNGTRDSFEGLFKHLFHAGHRDSVARISFIDSNLGRRALDIFFEDQSTLNIPLSKTENSVRITPLTFRWDVGNEVKSISLEIKDGSIRAHGNAQAYPLHFFSIKNASSKFDAQMFSQLSSSLRSEEVQRVIKQVFPYIEDLSLEIIGGETLIHARMDGFPDKIPVNELSGGLNKYLSIAIAIAANRNGVILIDEIEGGFFYRNQIEIMKSLVQLCDFYTVQMFASTHSWEFLDSVASVMKDRPSDFLILRTSREKTCCRVRKIEGSSSIAAITQDIEIRS